MSAVIVLRKLETASGKVEIGQRPKDGYINVTELCKAGGREFFHWHESVGAQKYLAAFDRRNPEVTPLDIVRGNFSDKRQQGTWAHPRVALRIAQWISEEFAVQVDEWLEWWFTEGYKYQDNVRRMLDMYIAPDPKQWEKRYCDEYYFHIYRLWGKSDEWYPGKTKHAPWVAGVTADLIYDRQFPTEVVAEMRRLNPPRGGRGSGRKRKHMQHMSDLADHAHLKPAVYLVTCLAEKCVTKEQFKHNLNFIAPRDRRQLVMPFEEFIA